MYVYVQWMSVLRFVRGEKTHIDLHFPVKAIVEKEVVCHPDPVGFHGMALAIIVVPYITLEREKKITELD